METKFIKKLNRAEAGFHPLMLLSVADKNSIWIEHKILIKYIEENYYSETFDLIKEQAFINALPDNLKLNHFIEVSQRFYSISTVEERFKFTGFAVKIITVNKEISTQKNQFLNILYDNWDLA